MFAQATSRIHVKRLFLMETGRYDAQFRRPYQTKLQGNTLNALTESLAGVKKFTASQLAGVANQIVAPSAFTESTIDIAGTWGEKRLRFMMEVECKQLAGGSIIVTVLGYTNYPGVIIHSSALDPQMEFYINSIISIRRTVETTPFGAQTYSNVIDNSHILVDPGYSGVYSNNQTHKMRPEDLYATMSMNHLSGLTDAMDLRTVLDQTPIASKRGNNIAAEYAANLLDGYTRANIDANFGVAREEDILDNARGYAQESMLNMNPFFKAISTFRDGFVSNFFTWRDLCAMDPNADNVAVVSMLGQTTQFGPAQGIAGHGQPSIVTGYDVQSGVASPWGGSELITQIATILSQSVPALMADFGLTVVAFASTNRRIFADAVQAAGPFAAQNRISTRVGDLQSFSDFDMAPYMDHFVAKLERLVLTDVSFNNEMDFFIEMQADLLGETWIKISMDGGPTLTFVTPSFADALLVPVVTSNKALSLQLSQTFETVFHHVSEHSGMGYAVNNTAAPSQTIFGTV
jgi:hypothetical protein